jgi:hypothetical protein
MNQTETYPTLHKGPQVLNKKRLKNRKFKRGPKNIKERGKRRTIN